MAKTNLEEFFKTFLPWETLHSESFGPNCGLKVFKCDKLSTGTEKSTASYHFLECGKLS